MTHGYGGVGPTWRLLLERVNATLERGATKLLAVPPDSPLRPAFDRVLARAAPGVLPTIDEVLREAQTERG